MTVRHQIIGLNRLLSDIYEEETKLSDILAKIGFSASEIEALASCHVEAMADACIAAIKERCRYFSGGHRHYIILVERYGLRGKKPQTLRSLGSAMELSGERVRQLQVKVLKRLRHEIHKALLEKRLGEVANGLLSATETRTP
jgi:DNA-directed RNA polymerase sigma subunit (sigma70/sigma32)